MKAQTMGPIIFFDAALLAMKSSTTILAQAKSASVTFFNEIGDENTQICINFFNNVGKNEGFHMLTRLGETYLIPF